jgi:sugar lactone lactonase YvrE
MGEGPAWEQSREQLIWVDTNGGEIHRTDVARGSDAVVFIGLPVGAAVPDRNGDLVLALPSGFFRLTAGEKPALIASVPHDARAYRLNDAKCDKAGRLWCGSLALDLTPAAGALYRLDRDCSVIPVLHGVTISNGMDWSPTGDLFYFIDSMANGIDVFDFDLDAGLIDNRRRVVDVPPDAGLADGMTVDAEGGIWVAVFGGRTVNRYTPSGELDTVVEMPVTHPTSCCFGGTNLDTLIITSARAGVEGPFTPEEVERQPLAGSVFAVNPGIVGLPITECAC